MSSAATLINDGGSVTILFGGKLRILGSLVNDNDATLLNSGFFDIRGNGTLTNTSGSSIENNNQLHVLVGTFSNAGDYENNNFTSVAATGSLGNTGTITNNGTITNQGLFTNDDTIVNPGTIQDNCGTFINNGTVTGNAVDSAVCWVGGLGTSWNTAANWNFNAVPSGGSRIRIQQGTPVLNTAFTLTGTGSISIRIANLTVGLSGSLINEGTISTFGGNLPGTSTLTVDGVLTNNGTVFNNNRVVNNGVFINNGTLEPSSAVGEIHNGGTFTNTATGSIENGLLNLPTGTFDNFGTFNMNRSTNQNSGVLSNKAGATLNVNNALFNNTGGLLENLGTVNVNHVLTVPGNIENEAGAVIFNGVGATLSVTSALGGVNNAGLIENLGTIANGGIITNSGVICGGVLTGNAVTGIPPLPTCNQPPTASAGGPYSGNEGSSIAVDGSGSTDDNGIALYEWDCENDGVFDTSSANPTGSTCTYDDNGSFTVKLRVTDTDGVTDEATAGVTVANVVPTVDAGSGGSTDEGSAVAFTGSFGDPGAADTHAVEWDFGDDGTASGTLTPSHAYADNGVYTVTLTVTDDDGGVGTDTLVVTVANVAPTVSAGPATATILSGNVHTIDVSATDPGSEDTHTVAVTWGDASSESLAVTQGAGTVSATGSHQYVVPGTYEITVTVTDDDGDAGAMTVEIEVVEPAAGLGSVIDDLGVAAAAETDPSAADDLLAALAWLHGHGGGRDGALERLVDGDREAAVRKLLRAAQFLDDAIDDGAGEEIRELQRQLAAIAEAIARESYAEAIVAVDPPSRGEIRQLARVQSYLDDGVAAAAVEDYVDAIAAFARAVRLAEDLAAS